MYAIIAVLSGRRSNAPASTTTRAAIMRTTEAARKNLLWFSGAEVATDFHAPEKAILATNEKITETSTGINTISRMGCVVESICEMKSIISDKPAIIHIDTLLYVLAV